MRKIITFREMLIAVTAINCPVLITPEPKLLGLLGERDLFEDFCTIETLNDEFPSEPGVYQCDIEYWYDPDEQERDLIPLNIKTMKNMQGEGRLVIDHPVWKLI